MKELIVEDTADQLPTTMSWRAADMILHERTLEALQLFNTYPLYSLLKPNKETLEAEKEKFFDARSNGVEYSPDLRPTIDVGLLALLEDAARQAKDRVVSFDADSEAAAVKMAYRWKINELIARTKILRAAVDNDSRKYNAYNSFIYGDITPEIFYSEVQTILADAQQFSKSDDENLSSSAREVVEMLSGIDEQRTYETVELGTSPELFKTAQVKHLGYYALSLDGISTSNEITVDEGVPAVKRMLKNLGANTDPFNYVVETTTLSTASVNHGTETVKYPAGSVYSKERFEGLYGGHEIGTHIRETINGYNTGFSLIQNGLDRSEIGGEGKGVLRESIRYASMDEFLSTPRAREIMLRHLSVAFTVGTDGTPRSFGNVYSYILAIEKMYRNANSEETTSISPEDYAWNLLAGRTHKGLALPGCAYRKDAVYAEGNYAMWKLIEQGGVDIDHWDIGKIDPSNIRHIALLQKLGVLPQADTVG